MNDREEITIELYKAPDGAMRVRIVSRSTQRIHSEHWVSEQNPLLTVDITPNGFTVSHRSRS